MSHIVFIAQSDAAGYSGQIDTNAGYPKPGVSMGQGRTGPTQTLRHADVVAHPTLPQWAYPNDPLVQAIATAKAIPLPLGATVQTIDLVAWGLATVAEVG